MNILFNLKEEKQLQELNRISKEVLLESWQKDLVSQDEILEMAMDIIYQLKEDIKDLKEEQEEYIDNIKDKSSIELNYHRRGID